MTNEATLCQRLEPPESVGSLGAVRSRRTVPLESGATGPQPEALPAASRALNWTSVSPSAATVREVPGCGADQLALPSLENRDS